jgi:hypothetical protein
MSLGGNSATRFSLSSGQQYGKEDKAGVAFAEGFRQHLGHSYPQDNLLGHLLGVC